MGEMTNRVPLKAYHVFTLDKLIIALVKQVSIFLCLCYVILILPLLPKVQTILSDYKCQEFLFLIQNFRALERVSNQDIIRYRREAEGIVGAEDPLYKIVWVSPILNAADVESNES
jgi:paired amphipathic helix protein Sin3a